MRLEGLGKLDRLDPLRRIGIQATGTDHRIDRRETRRMDAVNAWEDRLALGLTGDIPGIRVVNLEATKHNFVYPVEA